MAVARRNAASRDKPARGLRTFSSARPLVEAVDHGPAVAVTASTLGLSGDRWVEPFLEANRASLQRLQLEPTIDARSGMKVLLKPGPRIGAVPLLSPTTRRVVAGLLVAPRFRWSALGSVLGRIGFAVEPSVGGGVLVPGSAREVPAWLLAAPVVKRLEALLRHRKRGFIEVDEERVSPRGRIDWAQWARRNVPAGRWTSFPCRFPEPSDDPSLFASVRWTLARLDDELATFQHAEAARLLRDRVAVLRTEVGPGQQRRPANTERTDTSTWVTEALQAMGWIADERGLGGARALDGMSWDLRIDEVWEAWVDSFVGDLALRTGLAPVRRGSTHQRLNWRGTLRSMGALIPDSGLRGAERGVWIDAKYKPHLQQLAERGWDGLSDSMKDAHRADLHQALAYASLHDAPKVDSLLVYPALNPEHQHPPAIASVPSGRRRVRLILLSLPFGFHSPTQREETLSLWQQMLTA